MYLLVKLIISGRVQGVFYRKFVSIEAKKLGINGFTRNLYSGEVEVQVFHYDRAILENFINKCWSGSSNSNVTDIKQDWITIEDKDLIYSEFTVEKTI